MEPIEKLISTRILKAMEEKNATFRVIEGGPLEVTGKFRVVNSAGKIIENEGTVYLCRCGASRNKPFCDDSHKLDGFAM